MKKRWLLGALIALPTVIVVVSFVALLAVDRFERGGDLGAETTLVIERGSGLGAIARRLEDAGIIEDALLFRVGVRILGKAQALKAGEYRFPAGISMREAMGLLERGQALARKVTFPEGLTSAELVALLNQAEGLEGKITEIPPEGTLLPETYLYALNDSRAEILERMQNAFQQLLEELWSKRARELPYKDPAEAVVLASIVEKETALAEERRVVAGVFLRRLEKGMRLQSDPTVAYGLAKDQMPLGRALTREDLKTPSPYNTYLIDGLPPGPIASPGRAALEAALDPAETDYLYFVADGTGGHLFAKTLEEHNRNVAKWRRIQRQNQSQ